MEWILWLLATVIALSIGSFINVVIHRMPLQILQPGNGVDLWQPASHCPVCKKCLRWRDNIPVVSWLLLRGRCHFCRCAISLRYPLTETACATISLFFVALLPVDKSLLALLVLFWLLLTVAIIDYEHYLLPDVITLPLLWLGLLLKAVEWIPGSLRDAVFGAVIGYSALWLIRYIYQNFSGRLALGLGDAKLVAALGAWLGWALLPYVLLLACSGAICALFIAKMGWQRDLNQPLAFGPWIALAGISLFINTII
ncbi:A24 family peptidase [Erwinia sp. S59]|uniref:prepilin peptidase n=1 Tax=Erwinia sp. S59 TaxID=2769340 RepID=UPI00190C4A97|nr:A24 family peptidase [Erwinia sp. S59]MBK0091328.1 prepilin peptidase [Erwinia sp. S59]